MVNSISRSFWLTAWLIRIRWKELWRNPTRTRSMLIVLSLVLLALPGLLPAVVRLRTFAESVSVVNYGVLRTLALSIVYLALFVRFSVGRSSSSGTLRRYPFSSMQRTVASECAETVDLEMVLSVLIFLLPVVIAVTWVRVESWSESAFLAVGLLLLWFNAIALRNLVAHGAQLSLARNVAGILVLISSGIWLGGLTYQLLSYLWSASGWNTAMTSLPSWWPTVWWGAAIDAWDRGNVAMAWVGYGGIIGLTAFAMVLDARLRGYLEDAESDGAKSRKYRSLEFRVPGEVGLIFNKEWRALRRDRLTQLAYLSGSAASLMILVFLVIVRDQMAPYSSGVFLTLGILAVFFGSFAKGNIFTFERGGLRTLLVLPLPWRTLLVAFSVSQWVSTGVVMTLVMAMAAGLLGTLHGWLSAWGTALALSWCYLAAFQWISVYFPFPIERGSDILRDVPSSVGLLMLILGLVITFPVILLRVLAGPVAGFLGACLWSGLWYRCTLSALPKRLALREWVDL